MDLRSWFATLPKFRPGAFSLFLVSAILTLLLADQAVAGLLLLTPTMVLAGEAVWQPLTAIFLYPDQSAGHLFGTLLIQWFAGSELEQFWGRRKYLLLVLGASLAGYASLLVAALVSPLAAVTTVGGATAMDLAALTAFAVVFGRRPLRFFGALPNGARGLATIIIGLTVVAPLVRGAPWPYVLPWVVAIGIALLVTTQPWRRLGSARKDRAKKRRVAKSHLQVVPRDPKLLN